MKLILNSINEALVWLCKYSSAKLYYWRDTLIDIFNFFDDADGRRESTFFT